MTQNNANAEASPAAVQEHLSGVDYPCSKQDLIWTAKEQDAGDDVIELLQQIEDQGYDSPTGVTQAIGEVA